MGEGSALTQQQRNAYLLQFRRRVACRNCDTFPCHGLPRYPTHPPIGNTLPRVGPQLHRSVQLCLHRTHCVLIDEKAIPSVGGVCIHSSDLKFNYLCRDP